MFYYLAHGPEPMCGPLCGLSVHRDRRPSSVSSAWDLKVIVQQRFTKHLTNIIASPHPCRKVILMAPFYFKGITEWIAWLRRNTHSSNAQCPGPLTPAPSAILVQCSDTYNSKSTNSRGCRKGQRKGITHRDQTTKGTNIETSSLASQETIHGMSIYLYMCCQSEHK